MKARDGRNESWLGDPDHTAVVTTVERDGRLRILEQNVGGIKRVKEGVYNLGTLVEGDVKIFRAAPESWGGKLEPRWP